MEINIILSLFAAAIVAGTPILYAALGEIMTQRSGVLNLGVEGMMLVGAVTGFIFTTLSGNHWYGLLAAMLGGAFLASIHGFICVYLRGNQVVSGLALTIFGTGLSGFIGKNYQGMPAIDPFKAVHLPILGDVPILGKVLFQQDALVYISYIMVLVLWFILYRTPLGLNIRAVGENPAAADSMGINVNRVRFWSTFFGGAMAGMGGAYLSLAYAPSWQENMTAGRGWIAVALVIFALWNPLRGIIGSYLFGGVEASNFRMQTAGIDISPFFLAMLPYILTIIVLVLVTIRMRHYAGAPQALGIPYNREER